MGNRPGTNKNSYVVVAANSPEEFQEKLQKATDEINDKEGARHFATQTHMALGEEFTAFWSAVLFYDYDDEHQPESLKNKKLCPGCGELIPDTAEAHLKCGWNVLDDAGEPETEDVELESAARDIEDAE